MSRGLIVPVSCYLAVALGVPVLRGGLARPAFIHHALVVCAAALLLCAAWGTVRKLTAQRRRDGRL